jgi:hypothetical protein
MQVESNDHSVSASRSLEMHPPGISLHATMLNLQILGCTSAILQLEGELVAPNYW